MRGNPLSEWFRRDDWRMFGEQYVRTLTSGTPMDLDTVQRRLGEGDYEPSGVFSVETFARDVRRGRTRPAVARRAARRQLARPLGQPASYMPLLSRR